jgi:hydroxymethylbilane synthase
LTLRIATRGSALALAQAGQVGEMLGGAELVTVSSDGEPGDKGRFVRGVEGALLDGEAELGVHSAKDVPAAMPEGLVIAAVPPREEAADVWIGPGPSLAEAPAEARVGTASLRRRAQLLAIRPDLTVRELHGNVDTRLRKLAEGEIDAIVLAAAGLRRLGREDEVAFNVPATEMTPAAGQGALLIQARSGDDAAISAAAAIGDRDALCELTAERTVVSLLDATCSTPIGVRATVKGERLTVDAFVGLPDGSEWVRDSRKSGSDDPAGAGAAVAERLLAAGARDLLERAEALGALE